MIGIRMNKTVVLFGAVPVILPTVIICSRRIAVVFDPADGSPTTSDFESCWCRLVTRLIAVSQSESPPMPLNPEGQVHQIAKSRGTGPSNWATQISKGPKFPPFGRSSAARLGHLPQFWHEGFWSGQPAAGELLSKFPANLSRITSLFPNFNESPPD